MQQQEISFIVDEDKNGTYTLEDSLVVSYKTKHTLTIQYSNHTPWYLSKGAENVSTQKLAETWGQPKCPPISEWINKLWYIQTMDYYLAIKRNGLSSHKKTRKLRCILLSERSLSEKLHSCMITTIWHSGKGKTIETAKRWVIARGSGRRSKGGISGRQEIWGQWSYSVWSHNYRHTILQVCQNS